MRKSHNRHSWGYTLIELLAAVVITSVGFAALFTLQIRNLHGNQSAREMAFAVNLAEYYAAELRLNAFAWTSSLPTAFNRTEGQWYALTAQPVDQNNLPAESDDDHASAYKRQHYCVHFRILNPGTTYGDQRIAQLRVVWPRHSQDVALLTSGTSGNLCTDVGAAAFVPEPADWRTLTLPVALRRYGN